MPQQASLLLVRGLAGFYDFENRLFGDQLISGSSVKMSE
jgi:hypothetical protein